MGLDTTERGGSTVSRKPSLKAAIADIAAKRDIDKNTKRDSDITAEGLAEQSKSSTLPKVTLYAHADVLKALRRIAVEDGVQAQVILRRAVQEYLEKRGYTFRDLTTGE
jgi:hypothetical protein